MVERNNADTDYRKLLDWTGELETTTVQFLGELDELFTAIETAPQMVRCSEM